MTLTDEALDLKSVEGEYIRLYSKEILQACSDLLDRINGNNDTSLEDIVSACAIRCYQVSNADFTEATEESI